VWADGAEVLALSLDMASIVLSAREASMYVPSVVTAPTISNPNRRYMGTLVRAALVERYSVAPPSSAASQAASKS
jgi:hypothetical protein